MNFPKYLYRMDDAERFTLQNNCKYTMDSSIMHNPWEYTYDVLKSCGFVEDVKNCKIVEYVQENTGHGDEDDISC